MTEKTEVAPASPARTKLSNSEEQEKQKQQAQQNNQLHSLTKQNEISKTNERRLVEYFVILSSLPRLKQKQQDDEKDADNNKTDSNKGSSNNNEDNYDDLLQKRIQREENTDEGILCKYFNNIDFQPCITGRYPTYDHEGNELHDSISCFCFPCGSIRPTFINSMPKIHYFVSTGGKGQQLYGTCLTLFESYKISELLSMVETSSSTDDDDDDTEGLLPKPPTPDKDREVYVPKCICILSVQPHLIAFREFLTQLYRLTKSNDMPLPLERYIVNFCSEIPAPPPGAFEVQTTILDSTITLWCPPHNQPLAWVSLPFGMLFQCLDIDNIILIWHALTLERQILLTSTQLSLLTTCSEILLSLLYPMKWSHAYIPVLPHFLVPILSAPMPYLCGIDKYNLPSALFDLSKECIVVDLDVNHVTFGPQTTPLPPLPKYLSASLHQKLDETIGMVYREARCLSRNDNYKDRGIYLPSHIKDVADASWEGTLCLFDEAFHLYFTPEERRKNLLNGSDSNNANTTSNANTRFIYLNQREQLKKQQQSKWDIVQELFFKMYLNLLRSYRKYLIFPRKDAAQDGTYGGAGFVTKSFVSSQRYDSRDFLQQFCSTQMFDFFITKRLYGSGESDVIFFDEAMDRCFGVGAGGLGGTPLLQSAVVRNKLKTIVPPEPSALELPIPDMTDGVMVNCAIVSFGKNTDHDDISVVSHGSASTGAMNSSVYSAYSLDKLDKRFDKPGGADGDEEHGIGNYVYYYPSLPTSFSVDLMGKPRPLSSAVLAEFDRQREKAAKFRRKSMLDQQVNGKDVTSFQANTMLKPTAEIATFTVFFMAFTSIVGRELCDMSMKPEEPDKQILSTYIPPVEEIRPLFPTPRINDQNDSPWDTSKSSSTRRFSTLSNKVSIPIPDDDDDDDGSSSNKEDEDDNDDDDDDDDEFKSCGDEEIISRASLDHVSLDSSVKHSSIDGSVTNTSITDEQEQRVTRSHPWNDDDGSDTEQEQRASSTRSHPWSTNPNDISQITTDHEESSLDRPASPTRSMIDHGKATLPEEPKTPAETSSSIVDDVATPIINNSEQPRKRFLNPLHISKVLEAKSTSKAQLGLAFEMLTMMRQRELKADPYTYQCLIDACGRCGDTDRATTLLSRMHEDGIVADGVVYSCLVNAFSSENAWKKLMGNKDDQNLPEWANGNAVEMDWNKLTAKRSYVDVALEKFSRLKGNDSSTTTMVTDDDESVFSSTSFKTQPTQSRREKLKNRLGNMWARKKEQYGAVPAQESLNPHLTPSKESTHSNNSSNSILAKEIIVTEPIMRQILLGENLLELLYPNISIDADTDTCPRCRATLTDDDIVKGWKLADAQDYTTTCPYCTLKFVSHFSVQSTSTSFMGSKGPSSPLVCERLSPWVIQKELRTVMNDSKEIRNFVDPTWREKETKNAVLWWNLVLSFMRYRLPFTFLMQGSFGNKLITPCPDDVA